MSKETADILRRARALIDTPEKWTKDVLARDASGDECNPRSVEAKCYCIEGALMAACYSQLIYFDIRMPAYKAILNQIPITSDIPVFNDLPKTEHADVLTVFDRAIETEDATP